MGWRQRLEMVPTWSTSKNMQIRPRSPVAVVDHSGAWQKVLDEIVAKDHKLSRARNSHYTRRSHRNLSLQYYDMSRQTTM